MKHGWISLSLSLSLSLSPPLALAGELERHQYAEEILVAKGVPQQVAELRLRLVQAALGEEDFAGLDSSQVGMAREARGLVMDELAKQLEWTAIKKNLVESYARDYSEPELRQIRDFLTSSTGKKYLDSQSRVNGLISDVAREKMLKALPEILVGLSKQLIEKNPKKQ